MKMIIAIVEDEITQKISKALLNNNYRVTQMATTGGFLRGGATTLMVGVEDHQVDNALQVIRDQIEPNASHHQATLYVLNIKSFNQV